MFTLFTVRLANGFSATFNPGSEGFDVWDDLEVRRTEGDCEPVLLDQGLPEAYAWSLDQGPDDSWISGNVLKGGE